MKTISAFVLALGLCLAVLIGDASARGFAGLRGFYGGYGSGDLDARYKDLWNKATQGFPEEAAVYATGQGYPEEAAVYATGQDYPEENSMYVRGGYYSGGWGLDESD